MTDRPNSNLDWGGGSIEPSSGAKAAGFAPGDRPTAQTFNYVFQNCDGWIKYLQQESTKTKLKAELAALAQAPVNLDDAIFPSDVAVNPAGLIAAVGVQGPSYGDIRDASLTGASLGSSSTQTMNRVIWDGSLFQAVGTGEIHSSPDGDTWTRRLSAGATYLDVAADPVGGVRVAVAADGTVARSTNGTSWSTTTPFGSVTSRSIVWTGTQFVVVDSDGVTHQSTDGSTWSTGASHTLTDAFAHAVYFEPLDAVVIAGQSGSDWKVAYSIAGGAWAISSLSLSGSAARSITASPSGVYVSKSGQPYFDVSSDLETWVRAQHCETSSSAGSQVSELSGRMPQFGYASDLGVGAAFYSQFFSGNVGRSARF